MVELYPIVKLDAKETYEVFRIVPVDCIVVRLQDVVSKTTFGFNSTYQRIVSSGGLHNFLEFRKRIILSLIMRDQIIANFTPNKYATAIEALAPDYCTTIDGETYEGENWISLKEIERIQSNNKELVNMYPECKYIGLVKGCSEYQIEHHIELLQSIGITDFIFHIGDFLRHGRRNMIRRALTYSHTIRKRTNVLYLYGMGAQNRLIEFSFADVYISFCHFVTAKNGMMIIGTKKTKYVGKYDPTIMISNFKQMYLNVKSINHQTKLN